MTSSSTSTSWGPPLASSDWASMLPKARTAVLFWQESSCAIFAVAQGMERQSISLSQMTLIILPIVQVPMTKGTLRPNSDSLGTMRNTTSSSYPTISHTCMCRITKLSRLVHFLPNPTMSSNGRTGNPYCSTKVGMIVFT